MPIQNNIHVLIACAGEEGFVEDTSPRDIAPSSSTGDSSTVTTTETPGPTLTRHDSSLDLTETILTTWLLTTVTSANGTVEDVYYTDEAGNRLALHGGFSVSREYDPNQHSITGAINPGPSVYGVAPTPLATPLVKFIKSLSDKSYCIIVKVLPCYVFENPDHDFLRINLYIDGEERVVRTVSAQQIAERGGGRPWSVVIHGFVWKEIEVDDDNDTDPQDHDEWEYNLGTIRVCVERMRAEEGEESGEDAGESGSVEDGDMGEDSGVDAGSAASEEDEEDEMEAGGASSEEDEDDVDEEMEGAESEEDKEDEQEVILHKINVEERCLSHYTATAEPAEGDTPLGTASGRCVDGEPFLIFDFKYRSAEMLPLVAVVPQ